MVDTLPRAYLIHVASKEETRSVNQEFETFVHSVFLRSGPISRDILNDIHRETERDGELNLVIDHRMVDHQTGKDQNANSRESKMT